MIGIPGEFQQVQTLLIHFPPDIPSTERRLAAAFPEPDQSHAEFTAQRVNLQLPTIRVQDLRLRHDALHKFRKIRTWVRALPASRFRDLVERSSETLGIDRRHARTWSRSNDYHQPEQRNRRLLRGDHDGSSAILSGGRGNDGSLWRIKPISVRHLRASPKPVSKKFTTTQFHTGNIVCLHGIKNWHEFCNTKRT